MTTTFDNIQKQLSDLFGTYRAEWLQEQVFELFTEPRYFPELTTRQSCVLIGGRGTGKTTVLRGLSYRGQRALQSRSGDPILQSTMSSPFIGLYHRINTNHVAAFQGSDIAEQQWTKLFAHYFNIVICELLLEFLGWHEEEQGGPLALPKQQLKLLCKALHLKPVVDHNELHANLIESRIDFEASLNNIADEEVVPLSIQQRPIDLLCECILSLSLLKGKHFFFLLDEYENLLPYQQRVVNTLIKHTSGLYFFKIGVRELGWSCRSTLQPDEQLVAPADYALVRIGDRLQGEAFLSFAIDVCEKRLRRVVVDGECLDVELRTALPGLSVDEEAVALGVEDVAASIMERYKQDVGAAEMRVACGLSPLELFFVDGWASAKRQSPAAVLEELISEPTTWKQRFDNYKYAALFAIRRGKRGIDKFYCGLDTFALMAGGNIRYMLELVDHAFLNQIRSGDIPTSPIAVSIQTAAAQHVGSMNLSELEGLSVSGARLTKLLLGMGRVFQQLAASPFGHAPEMNQFHLNDLTPQAEELLRHAVMHLALVRYPGTKLGDQSDTLEYDYTIHPVFSALFEFSPRRKRKMEVACETIERLITAPQTAIDQLLKAHNRTGTADLPRQLTLFSQFYNNE